VRIEVVVQLQAEQKAVRQQQWVRAALHADVILVELSSSKPIHLQKLLSVEKHKSAVLLRCCSRHKLWAAHMKSVQLSLTTLSFSSLYVSSYQGSGLISPVIICSTSVRLRKLLS
jgi:hypothetical protein